LSDAAQRTRASDIVLVCGSFYVVGPALDELYSRARTDSLAASGPKANG
jgi:hypothetical protein